MGFRWAFQLAFRLACVDVRCPVNNQKQKQKQKQQHTHRLGLFEVAKTTHGFFFVGKDRIGLLACKRGGGDVNIKK